MHLKMIHDLILKNKNSLFYSNAILDLFRGSKNSTYLDQKSEMVKNRLIVVVFMDKVSFF